MLKQKDIKDSLKQRFWKYVTKKDSCWEWVAKSKVQGYGVIGIGGRKEGKILSHRLSYVMHKGDIPECDEHHGMVVMHTCDNRLCVNPDHLVLGTQKDNVKDMDEKGRRVTVVKKGEAHHMTTITAGQAKEIYLANGVYRLIAERFGCTVAVVKSIKRRVTWRHATESIKRQDND